MSERKLAYASTSGVVHEERYWISSRQHLYGETYEKAQAEINSLISRGVIIIIENKS